MIHLYIYSKRPKLVGWPKRLLGWWHQMLHANQCLSQACEDVNSWARGTGILELHEPTVQNWFDHKESTYQVHVHLYYMF